MHTVQIMLLLGLCVLVDLTVDAEELIDTAEEVILLNHPDVTYNGPYFRSDEEVNGLPLFVRESLTRPLDSPYRYKYLYCHKPNPDASKRLWVVQEFALEPSKWRANSYGHGKTPWEVDWTHDLKVVLHDDHPGRKRSEADNAVDLMVLYTEMAAKQAIENGGAPIVKRIRERVDAMNQAFYNSGLKALRMRLVHVAPTEYKEESRRSKNKTKDMLKLVDNIASDFVGAGVNNPGVTAHNVRASEVVRERREAVGADLVSVFVSGPINVCGIGRNTEPLGARQYPEYGYSILQVNCYGSPKLSMAHEIGHNFGLLHDRGTLKKPNTYDSDNFNYGYVNKQTKFFTIMAYSIDCGSLCRQVPYFSNPKVISKKYKVPVGASNANSAEYIRMGFNTVSRYLPSHFGRPRIYPEKVDLGEIDKDVENHIPLRVYNLTNKPQKVFNISQGHSGDTIVRVVKDRKAKCHEGVVIPPRQSVPLDVYVTGKRQTSDIIGDVYVEFESRERVHTSIRGDSRSGPSCVVNLRNGSENSFGRIVQRREGTLDLLITNVGRESLQISKLTISGDPAFKIKKASDIRMGASKAADPGKLPFNVFHGKSTILELSCSSNQVGLKRGTVTIESNDPERGKIVLRLISQIVAEDREL